MTFNKSCQSVSNANNFIKYRLILINSGLSLIEVSTVASADWMHKQDSTHGKTIAMFEPLKPISASVIYQNHQNTTDGTNPGLHGISLSFNTLVWQMAANTIYMIFHH